VPAQFRLLIRASARYWDDEADGRLVQNGRARQTVERLAELGLIEYEFDLRWGDTDCTEAYRLKPTAEGDEYLLDRYDPEGRWKVYVARNGRQVAHRVKVCDNGQWGCKECRRTERALIRDNAIDR